MAREDLVRTDWYPAILQEKVDKVRVADAADRAAVDPVEVLAEGADLAAPAALAVAVGCSAERLVAEEQGAAECLVAAAD